MVRVHYGKLTLKIYTKANAFCVSRRLFTTPKKSFPRVAGRMRGMVDRVSGALHAVDACFIADDTLEQLPEGLVGQTKVGGIDCNQLRIRTLLHAAVAPSTAPQGFTPPIWLLMSGPSTLRRPSVPTPSGSV